MLDFLKSIRYKLYYGYLNLSFKLKKETFSLSPDKINHDFQTSQNLYILEEQLKYLKNSRFDNQNQSPFENLLSAAFKTDNTKMLKFLLDNKKVSLGENAYLYIMSAVADNNIETLSVLINHINEPRGILDGARAAAKGNKTEQLKLFLDSDKIDNGAILWALKDSIRLNNT